jgi:ribonuclease BN (tRNA processing enzyme)
VQVLLVPSSVSPEIAERMQFLSSYVINDTVAIDAGCIGFYRTPAEQARIKHLFLTHAHLDHIASLPMFLDNVYSGDGHCVTIYASESVIDCLRHDVFNDRLWPDFLRISQQRPPYLRVQCLQADQPLTVAGLTITPIEMNHAVPTFGYIVSDGVTAVAIPSDTAPTTAIWERANATPNLAAVFMETSISNDMAWLAEIAKHLTPNLLVHEVRKVTRPVRWVIVHIHSRCRDEVLRQLAELEIPGLEIARFGIPYIF